MTVESIPLKKIFVPERAQGGKGPLIVRRGPGGMGPQFVAISGAAMLEEYIKRGKRMIKAQVM